MKQSAPVIRIAVLKNPKTKRDAMLRVTKEGRIAGNRYAKLYKVSKVAAWTEVEAASWKEATKLVRAGKGRRVRAKLAA